MKDFKRGLTDGLPIALGYLSVSFTFGLAAVRDGLDAWQAVLISFTCLTSAGQFAGLDIMLSAGSYIEMMLVQLIINIRYSVMSVIISQKADESMNFRNRLVTSFGVTDEVFAVAVGKNKSLGASYMLGLMSLPILGWSFGTFLGAVIGSVLPLTVVNALGIGIYAMFLAIIIPPARRNKAIAFVIAIAAFFSSVRHYTVLKEIFSSGSTIIAVSIISAVLTAFLFPIKDDEDTED